jgi:hypothetical protein
MGWPRKNDLMRIYRDKDKKTYFLLEVANGIGPSGYDAIANVYSGTEPSLGSCTISPNYISDNRLKRMQWSELPTKWQKAFQYWLNFDDLTPQQVRGFWRMGQQPTA